MKREQWFFLICLFLICVMAATPGTPRRQVFDAPLYGCGHHQQTDVSSVYYPTVPTKATEGRFQPEDQNVRYRDDCYAGSLSTRTDNDTGVCTVVETNHGITVSHTVAVWWAAGKRTGMSVTAVSGTVITVDGGSGDNLPALSTAIEIGAEPTASVGNLIYAGDVEFIATDLRRVRFLQTAASAKLNCNYKRP